MVEIKSFDSWQVSTKFADGSGRSEKKWLENGNAVGLFKFPKKSCGVETYEHVSEKLASDISKIIGLRCAEVDIGTYNNRIGSMSYLVMDYPKETLIEALDLITILYPEYDSNTLIDKESGKMYSFDMAIETIEWFAKFHNMDSDELISDFVKILVFDFLIGNSDRHHSNWAFVCNFEFTRVSEAEKSNFLPKIAPVYDNGSSLCAIEREENIDAILNDKNRFKAMCTTKSKTIFRFEGSKRLNHQQFLDDLFVNKRIKTDFPETICSTLNDATILNILNKYDNVISSKRKSLIYEFLKAKVKLLEKYTKG